MATLNRPQRQAFNQGYENGLKLLRAVEKALVFQTFSRHVTGELSHDEELASLERFQVRTMGVVEPLRHLACFL